MGLRRLRGRLDQLQGNANFTMAEIQALVEDLQDGFGVEIDIDEGAATKLAQILLSGKAATLPFRVRIVPEIDT